MTTKQLAIVSALVAAVLAVIIVLLVTGSPPTDVLAQDPEGDVELGEGEAPPADSSLADIREARVHQESGGLVFEARVATEVPQRDLRETLELRWEVLEEAAQTWTVTASLGEGAPVAAVSTEKGDYAASTIDDTLPGTIEILGARVLVRLDAAQLERFPEIFTWRLVSSLDADPADPASAMASDTAPASGLGEYRSK